MTEEQRLSDILDREGISGLLKQEFVDIQAKYREDKNNQYCNDELIKEIEKEFRKYFK